MVITSKSDRKLNNNSEVQLVQGFKLFIADQAAMLSQVSQRERQEPESTRRSASSAAVPNSIVNRKADRGSVMPAGVAISDA